MLAAFLFIAENRSFGQGAGVGAAARQAYPTGQEDRGEEDMSMEESMMEDAEMMDEEMMEGYDDMYGEYGGGSGRRSRGTGTSAVLQQFSASQSTGLLSRLDLNAFINPPGVVAPADAGPVLRSDAEMAFKNGHFPLALELFFGHMAVDYEKARGDIQTAQYSRLMRRPTWSIRWGVSIAVRGEARDPNPIRDTGSGRLASTGRGGFGGGDEFGTGGEGLDGMDEDMRMQEEMMEREMEMEMEMGNGLGEDGMMSRGPGGSGRGRGPGRNAPAPVVQREMLSSEADELLSKNVGLVAEKLAQGFDKRFRAGDFGNALITVGAPVEGVVASSDFMSDGFTQAIDTSPEPIPMWKPGLLFLGEGDSKDMAAVARSADVDLYFHFDVLLKELRGEWVQNISRVRIIHAASGKTLGTSKSFDNLEVANLVRAGRGSESSYVDERLETLFGIVDRQAKTSPLPGLTTDIARRRVGQLLSGPRGRNLRTLAEVRLYQAQNLLTEEEVESAFHIVGGEEGLILLHGSHEERMNLARTWAVNSLKAQKR